MPLESLGILETNSFSGSLKAINEIKKTNGVKFIGKQFLGDGIVSVFIKGELGAIRKALQNGADVLNSTDGFRSSHIIPMPHKDLLLKFNLERNGL